MALCILQKWDMLPFTFTPWVDGKYLPEHPAQLVLEGRHAQVDIMAGSTRDEGAFFTLRKCFYTCMPVALIDYLEGAWLVSQECIH